MTITAITLDRAVRSLCPDIAIRVRDRKVKTLAETDLWQELACCVLSSQVRYETAVAAVRHMRVARIFHEIYEPYSDRQLTIKLTRLLKAPLTIRGRVVHYRFPESRALQLVDTRRNFLTAGVTLREIAYGPEHETEKRRRLVSLVCGFGPKQASMFLRASGVSYGLAILDRHALRFMSLLNLTDERVNTPSLTLRRYESLEWRFGSYAESLGYPIGYVDWAVWIVMRALGGTRP